MFQMHLLSSPENQEIISKRKEELAKAKSKAYKRFLEEKQKKKELTRKIKVTVRSNKVQARSLSAPVRVGVEVGSGRSRIFCWGGADQLGGANLRHICFSVKTNAKMKELDPVGGHVPGAPPWICQCKLF